MDRINEFNLKMKNKMKQSLHNPFEFKWADSDLISSLLFGIPRITVNSNESDEARKFVQNINDEISKYNQCLQTGSNFLVKIKSLFEKSIVSFERPFRYNYNYFKNEILKQNRLVLHGPGGIGKSFFIYYLCEEYEKNSIFFFTIYGKWFDDECIDILKNDLIVLSKSKRIVLLIDAINEIDSCKRVELLNIINDISSNENIPFIITYRDNAFNETELSGIDYYSSLFDGIEYRQAINEIIERTGENIIEYEDLLETNNPLFMQLLYETLKDGIGRKESLITVTHILEHYIKDKKCCSLDCWNLTKDIASLMFEKGRKRLSKEEILGLKKSNIKNNLKKLIEYNFIDSFEMENKEWFFFTLDTFADFLIARSLFDEIKNGHNTKYVNVSDKLNNLYSLQEMLPIIAFDYSDSFEKAINILENFDYTYSLEVFSRIKFKYKNFNVIQERYGQKDFWHCFTTLCGLPDKPYNCSNYLNDFLKNKDVYLKFASEQMNSYYGYGIDTIISRLKNILYFLDFHRRPNDKNVEFFWYSIWCLGLGNKELIDISIKILITLCECDNKYIDMMINNYDMFDELIQENIVVIICHLPLKYQSQYNDFLKTLFNDFNYIHAENITRISKKLFNDYSCIIERKVKMISLSGYNIFEDTKKLINMIDLYDKTFLRFKSNFDDTYSIYNNFLDYKKNKIKRINNKLKRKYKCIISGDCNGTISFPIHLSKKYHIDNNKTISPIFAVKLFSYFLEKELKEYNINIPSRFDYDNFSNTFFSRIVLLAQNKAFGLLVSNYYCSTFISANDGTDFIGFKPYDSLEFEYEKHNYNSIIPNYSETLYRLDSAILKKLNNNIDKDEKWADNLEESKRIVLSFFSPISIKGVEWRPIALYINNYIKKEGTYERDWEEHYNFYINLNMNLNLIGDHDDRYITIETEQYLNNIYDYIDCSQDENKCYSCPCLAAKLEHIKENSVLLPPSKILKVLNLDYDAINCSWNNEKKEPIIICNRQPISFEKNPISNSIYIRNDYYKKLLGMISVHYFGFTEKYYKNKGYSDKSSFDFEVKNDDFTDIKMHYNNVSSEYRYKQNDKCKKCKRNKKEKNNMNEINIEEILKRYQSIVDEDSN